ncbi:MAG: Flp family type IVb pilin [Gemmatimonadaceae bacterium]
MAVEIAGTIRSFVEEEEGIAASEYALMLGLIALLLFLVIRVFGQSLSAYWNNVNGSVFSQ